MPETSYPKDRIRILLLENISPAAEQTFRDAGYALVDRRSRAMTEDELIDEIGSVHILGIRSKTHLTRRVLEAAENLWAVGCFCIGTNQVDLDAAAERGIAVFNSPFSNTRSVAELVIASAVMLIRRIPAKDRAAHAGVWAKDHTGCYELRNKTLGIVGYGRIGSQVSVLAEAFGMRVLFHDIESRMPMGNAHGATLDEVLSQSDVVTVHVPATPETKGMMTAERIATMGDDSILINMSRGNVVDLDALAGELRSGRLKGAAIDVYPQEPKRKGDAFDSPLRGLDNVFLTPHIGGSTEEAQYNIGIDAATKLVTYLETGSSMGSHTVPEVSVGPQDAVHRILHIHENVPGVLSAINGALSELGVNVIGQSLTTNQRLGYVVLDVARADSVDALHELRSLPHTIKARVLY